ncbi:MAG TPA: hypothetical protein VMU81_13010 [Acetobacteraceae bacterium]|nr:hypothetical protein [Acetobacteraceae bacterium]
MRERPPRQTTDIVKPGPYGFTEILDARIDRDETKALVEAEGDTDKPAIDVDDVGLQHGMNPNDGVW